jgi:hypothetical protein
LVSFLTGRCEDQSRSRLIAKANTARDNSKYGEIRTKRSSEPFSRYVEPDLRFDQRCEFHDFFLGKRWIDLDTLEELDHRIEAGKNSFFAISLENSDSLAYWRSVVADYFDASKWSGPFAKLASSFIFSGTQLTIARNSISRHLPLMLSLFLHQLGLQLGQREPVNHPVLFRDFVNYDPSVVLWLSSFFDNQVRDFSRQVSLLLGRQSALSKVHFN